MPCPSSVISRRRLITESGTVAPASRLAGCAADVKKKKGKKKNLTVLNEKFILPVSLQTVHVAFFEGGVSNKGKVQTGASRSSAQDESDLLNIDSCPQEQNPRPAASGAAQPAHTQKKFLTSTAMGPQGTGSRVASHHASVTHAIYSANHNGPVGPCDVSAAVPGVATRKRKSAQSGTQVFRYIHDSCKKI